MQAGLFVYQDHNLRDSDKRRTIHIQTVLSRVSHGRIATHSSDFFLSSSITFLYLVVLGWSVCVYGEKMRFDGASRGIRAEHSRDG